MKKVLVTFSKFDTNCKQAISILEQYGFSVFCALDENKMYYSTDELQHIMADIDAVIIGLDRWDGNVLEYCPKLKVIARFGVGIDNIDLEAATKRRIYVFRAKGGNARSVAELALAHILNLTRNISRLNDSLQNGEWPRSIGTELTGKTVGLIGFGDTARHLAQILAGFDVKIIACRRSNKDFEDQFCNVSIVTLDEVLANSDIVSLHIPFSKENYHMFDKTMISKLKKGAYMVNTARGALIDETALIEAVESGHIAGAALDVYEKEPIGISSKLLGYERIICTPHTASETYEAYARIGIMCAKGITDVFEDRVPENWVNPW